MLLEAAKKQAHHHQKIKRLIIQHLDKTKIIDGRRHITPHTHTNVQSKQFSIQVSLLFDEAGVYLESAYIPIQY